MGLASRYGSFGIASRASGRTLMPPADTTAILVCRNAPAGRLSCQNLNGDTHAPVGAGVYAANRTPAWQAITATRAASEYRLLSDLRRYGTIIRGGDVKVFGTRH